MSVAAAVRGILKIVKIDAGYLGLFREHSGFAQCKGLQGAPQLSVLDAACLSDVCELQTWGVIEQHQDNGLQSLSSDHIYRTLSFNNH